MNIEVPLSDKESIGEEVSDLILHRRASRESLILSYADTEVEQGVILDDQHPYALIHFPSQHLVQVIHLDRAKAVSCKGRARSILNRGFVTSALHRTTHGMRASGGDSWAREVQSSHHLFSRTVRCTRFGKTKMDSHSWRLDLKEAVEREIEVDVHLSTEREFDDSAKEEEDDDEDNEEVSVLNGRLMADRWVEIFVETLKHRLVVMWHPQDDVVKRWHLSPTARLSHDSPDLFPSIIVDNGRGFLPLGSHMSDRDLLAMVMVHSGATAADNLCTMNQMDRCTIPLRALEASLVHRQLDTVAFYLTSSINVVDQKLFGKSALGGDDTNSCDLSMVAKDLKDAVGLILTYMDTLCSQDNSLQNVQYCQQLAYMLHEFMIKMLTMIEDESGEDEELPVLIIAVHKLFLSLKRFMETKPAEKRHQSLRRLMREQNNVASTLDAPLTSLYSVWDRFAHPDIIVDAMRRNTVPLMVDYLTQRGAKVSAAEMRKCGLAEVRLQLRNQSWDSAHVLLLQMGLEPKVCFEEILWETGSLTTRDFLLQELSQRCMLSTELEGLWRKVEKLEEVYGGHRLERVLEGRMMKDAGLGGKESVLERMVRSVNGPGRKLSDVAPRCRRVSSRVMESEEDDDTDDDFDEEAAICLSYHRFRLCALRNLSDATLLRMLMERSADISTFPISASIPFLVSHLEMDRLFALLTPSSAPLLLSPSSPLPAYHMDLVRTQLAHCFHMFESPLDADPRAQILRYLQRRDVPCLISNQMRLLPCLMRTLILNSAPIAVHELAKRLDADGRKQMRMVLTEESPRWARLAVDAIDVEPRILMAGESRSGRDGIPAKLLVGEAEVPAHSPKSLKLNAASPSDLYRLLAINGHGWSSDETPRPNFGCSRLVERFGNRERLRFTFYLLRCRPAFAFISLLLSVSSRRGVEQRKREAVLWAHQVALERFSESAVVGACLAFIQLLSHDLSKVRSHLLCLRAVYEWRRAHGQSQDLSEMVSCLLQPQTADLGPILAEYESAVLWRHRDPDDSRLPELLLDWSQVLQFAALHHTRLPTGLLEELAGRGDWLTLLTVAQLFPFRKVDLRAVLARFEAAGLRDHLSRVIDKAHPVAVQEPPLLPLPQPHNPPRDRRLQFYSTLGMDVPTPSAPSPAPSSVLASSADSDSLHASSGIGSSLEEEFDATRLMAAIEALTTDSLFELLLTVRLPRALLAYSMTLSHPLLAILAVCTASSDEQRTFSMADRFSYMAVFLIASLPTGMKETYVALWGGNLKVAWTPDEVLDLFRQTLCRHQFREVEDAAHIFLLGNPLDCYIAYVRSVLESRDAVRRVEALRRFSERQREWSNHLAMRGLVDNVEEEAAFTHQLIDVTLPWVCAETLRDLSAHDLRTVVEELSSLDVLSPNSSSSFLLHRLSQVLHTLLDVCELHVDATNFCTTEEGLMESCLAFTTDLMTNKRFLEARQLLAALDNPSPPVERLFENIEMREREEREERKSKFTPALSSALGRVLGRRKRREAEQRREDEEEDLVFRPREDPDWAVEVEEPCGRTLVHQLLDEGRLKDACAAAGPGFPCQWLRCLLAAVVVARGDIEMTDLPSHLVEAMSERRVRPVATPDRCNRLPITPSQPLRRGSALPQQFNALPSPLSRLLESLPLCLGHGGALGERVSMLHRVAVAVDAPYAVLVANPPLSVLCKILAGTIVNKVTIAEYFIRARRPPTEVLNRFLLRVALMVDQVSDQRVANIVSLAPEVENELALLGRSLPTKVSTSTAITAHELIRVSPRPLHLGELFLETLRRCLFEANTVPVGTDVDYELLVKLVVLGERCMEQAGSTEGSAECLRLAMRVTNVLNIAEQYRALVHLLIGMRRFGEMNYIFHILIEKQHIEPLLSKEATKDNRFKIAIIEYLSRYRPDDQETFEMVTAHFSMTRESAEAQEKKGQQLVRKWCRLTDKWKTAKNSIHATAMNETRQRVLDDAVQALILASDQFLRLQCQRHARRCFRHAQLCALQARIDDSRLLRGAHDDLSKWTVQHPEFYEAFIVCESSGLQPRPWVRALWEHVVVKGDNRYLSKFADYVSVDGALLHEVAAILRRQQRQQYVQNFKFLLNLSDDVRLVTDLRREFGLVS